MFAERHVMVILCALCCMINYADRVNISVAIIPLAREYSFSLSQQSIIMSVFYIGYLPMQLGGALLCRRFGGKTVLSMGAFLWSLFTILTPIAAGFGYYPLLVVRVLMGLSEGVAFPSVFHFLSAWIPAAERARSIALFLTGAHVGTTIALVFSPLILARFSWHIIFYIFGAMGFVWILIWQIFASNKEPLRQSSSNDYVAVTTNDTNEQHTNEQQTNEQTTPSNTSIPMEKISLSDSPSPITSILTPVEQRCIRFILTNKKCMAVVLAQAFLGLVHYTIISWLPTYFNTVFTVEISNLSFTFLPYFAMAVAANLGGYLADFLLGRGLHLTRVRQLITIISNIGAIICLLLFTLSQSVNVALACITLSMAFMSLNSGGFESSYMDLSSPALTGLFKAVANTMGSLSGFIAIPLSSLIYEWLGESWRGMFATLSIWYMLLCISFCTWASSERILTEDVK